MKKYLSLLGVVVGITILMISSTALAIDGEEIISKVDETLESETRKSEIQMTIINENDQKRDRTIEIYSKGEGKGLIEFLAPADVEGTTFLTLEKEEEENMWLYLPAVGNVRKIASHMKSGNFMGTDFSYNDISMLGGSNYKNDYQSTLKEEVEYEGKTCYLLESNPSKEDIQYSKMKMWVNKENFMPLKLEFYDNEGKLLKVMTNKNIEQINGHLTPQKITMKNVQQETQTVLTLNSVEYNVEIPDRIFTTRYMERQ